jgi:hypothetical protein
MTPTRRDAEVVRDLRATKTVDAPAAPASYSVSTVAQVAGVRLRAAHRPPSLWEEIAQLRSTDLRTAARWLASGIALGGVAITVVLSLSAIAESPSSSSAVPPARSEASMSAFAGQSEEPVKPARAEGREQTDFEIP